jgi:hypothetical protein
MTTQQLRHLHELVHAAQAVADRPWEPGETSRPITFFTDHLRDEGWRLGRSLVASLRERHADLFRYYGEATLHRSALELLLAADAPLSVDEIALNVRRRRGSSGREQGAGDRHDAPTVSRCLPRCPPPGHVSIRPRDPGQVDDWMAARGSGQTHPLSRELQHAIVST